MNILFVGNSYTYYNEMPALFEKLCRENGRDVTVYSVTKGGRELRAYGDSADETTAALDALVREHKFDICFLQEQSTLPLRDYDAFIAGLECVMKKVRGCTERFILYATWGRKEGSHTLKDYGWTNRSMTEQLRDAYNKAAAQLGAEVSQVGQCFYEAAPGIELYAADLSHPSFYGSCLAALTHYRAVFRQLPGSMESLALDSEVEACFRRVLS